MQAPPMQLLTWSSLLERHLPSESELVAKAANALEEGGFKLAQYVVEDAMEFLQPPDFQFKPGERSAIKRVLQRHQAETGEQRRGRLANARQHAALGRLCMHGALSMVRTCEGARHWTRRPDSSMARP
jgi:hypothetical protein